jgi:hypothetical protein
MRISAAFPSTYLKAADLQGRTVPVAIDRVELEEIGGEHKPILYFQGKEKGLVLNKTNANNIAAVYGDDTDDWIGGGIQLFPTMVDFQGRSVEAIRVRVAPRKAASAPQPKPASMPQNGGHADLDEMPTRFRSDETARPDVCRGVH